ncbi:hypothetical protein MARCHEWKA_04360 [Brevundimonas phage vB_BpoS-Marchewka]|uniref:Uncharacterized protein n=1 Tax=Brevundimonas phage vB_BpoS-Marchewka TaxID=2948604 RepID=A0A9E7N538_9CAUD|nr:hypothetical protein MARCHEWKA_04360 [Brevundimonas phage vB_BpoS-Marchewka]
MPKPAPPPTDMEALVRRPKKAQSNVPSPIDMEALVRRPQKPNPPPAAQPPGDVDMEALVRRPKKAPAAVEPAEDPRIQVYIQNRVNGWTPVMAAGAAGYSGNQVHALESDPDIQARIAQRLATLPGSVPQSTGSGFYGKPAPATDMEALVRRAKPKPTSGSLTDYTLYAMARKNGADDGFKGTFEDYVAQHGSVSKPGADMNALVARKNTPAPAPNMEALVRRPPPPAAPVNANARRNQQVNALIERARQVEPSVVEGMRFNTRLHRFLDLRPTAWTTWGEDEARVVVQSASGQAEASRQLSLANAVKWAAECEQAYAKPPGFMDRFSQQTRPEFYRVRLEQARDMLIKVQDDLQQVQDLVRENLDRLRIDVVVLQVATEQVTDASDSIIATRRLQTLVQVQATAAMILQGCESLAQTAAAQAATVSSLLTVTIPNWIIAQQNR